MPVVARKVSDGKKRVLSVKKNGETLLPPRTSSHPPPSPSSSSSSSSSASSCFDALPDHLKEEIFVEVANDFETVLQSDKLLRTIVENSVRTRSRKGKRDRLSRLRVGGSREQVLFSSLFVSCCS